MIFIFINLFLASKRWAKPEVTGEAPRTGRHGHTACAYKNSIIIFGGQHQFNPTLNYRECLNDVRKFTPIANEWEHIRCSGRAIEARWNHAAVIYENKMFVYGGVNSEGKKLIDVCVLSFSMRNSFIYILNFFL